MISRAWRAYVAGPAAFIRLQRHSQPGPVVLGEALPVRAPRWAPAAVFPQPEPAFATTRPRSSTASAAPSAAASLLHTPAGTSAHTTPKFNTDNALSHKSTPELIGALCLFKACSSGALVAAACKTVEVALTVAATSPSASPATWALRPLAAPVLWAVKATAFRQFCAGETLEDCTEVSRRLWEETGVRTILDHSTEESEAPEAWEGNLERKIALLRTAAQAGAAFVPVKVTALGSPALLEAATAALEAAAEGPACLPHPALADPRPHLSPDHAQALGELVGRLQRLAAAARSTGVPLLLDAEQSPRQPAIDFIARQLSKQFNASAGDAASSGDSGAPACSVVVYNTFQLYLTGKLQQLQAELEAAEAGGYALGCKLVRGAYVASEEERARRLRRAPPLQAGKEATDRAYDAAVALALRRVAAAPASAAVLIATHNRQSIERAVDTMQQLSLPPSHPAIHLAQILGMVDHLTCALGREGYNALKLVPYGRFEEVAPWLLRRLQENQDALGGVQQEIGALYQELRRRRG